MGKFVVSARKYRPQKFSEVVGQESITSTLANALRTDHLAHAFLFCGPRGVGKTTCARILAKTLNCENVQNEVDPCEECASCKSFAKNASFNIIELDAASNNGVDHMRDLNEQVRFAPQEGKYKVYIIDEVHMLSTAAFNAFLKTLEEPPPHAIFILATTEKHKILPTILSRCQIFDFKRITVKDTVTHLQGICKEEGITAEKDALTVIAQKSDGALRDALSLFDRLASVSENEITYKTVVENLNLLDYEVFFKTADACLREDVRDVLLIFDKVLKDGFEGNAFLQGLASHFRDLLVCQDPRTIKLQDHSESLKNRYLEQASLTSLSFIFSALNIINETDISYQYAHNKRLHVEMALSKVCFINRLTTIAPFSAEKKTLEVSQTPLSSKKTIPKTVIQASVSTEKKIEPTESIAAKPTVNTEAPQAPIKNTPKDTPKDTTSKATEKPKTAIPTIRQAPMMAPMIPQIKSISAIGDAVITTEKEAQANKLELSTTNLKTWWSEYQNGISSPSVLATFKQTTISLSEESVCLEVNSPMAKTRIQDEAGLLTQLRKDFHLPKLDIKFIVTIPDEDSDAENKKPVTDKEKYEWLIAKNPELKHLREKLDLKMDNQN